MGRILDDWKRQHFTEIEAPGLGRAELEAAAGAFFEFLKLPEEAKTAICRTLTGEEDRTRIDIGYMRRIAEYDGDREEKMYFHYHPDIEVLYKNDIERAGESAQQFMRVARGIWDKAIAIGRGLIEEFDTEWPGTYARFFPEGQDSPMVIRFLAYMAEGNGDFLAKPHYDRGTFTIALGESAPGLRIGTPEKLTPIEHREGYAVALPGTSFTQDISQSVEPAWHDVVQNKDAQYSTDTARWAIVSFFDVADKSYISKEMTSTPRSLSA